MRKPGAQKPPFTPLSEQPQVPAPIQSQSMSCNSYVNTFGIGTDCTANPAAKRSPPAHKAPSGPGLSAHTTPPAEPPSPQPYAAAQYRSRSPIWLVPAMRQSAAGSSAPLHQTAPRFSPPARDRSSLRLLRFPGQTAPSAAPQSPHIVPPANASYPNSSPASSRHNPSRPE